MLLRPATLADAAAIAAIYRPYCEETPISFEVRGPDSAEIAARMGRLLPQYPWLVAEDQGVVAGYAYASPHRERAAYRWSVDAAVYLRPEFHGQGIGAALYRALFSLLREQGYFRVHAGIVVPNPASQALHTSFGFSLVGIYRSVGFKAGAWRDVAWWQLQLRPATEAPAEPRSWHQLAGTPAWTEALTGAFAAPRT